jgi:hypothetical protein
MTRIVLILKGTSSQNSHLSQRHIAAICGREIRIILFRRFGKNLFMITVFTILKTSSLEKLLFPMHFTSMREVVFVAAVEP